MKYEKILKQVELLQSDLMDIDEYSEEVYQAFKKLIETLEEQIEDNE